MRCEAIGNAGKSMDDECGRSRMICEMRMDMLHMIGCHKFGEIYRFWKDAQRAD